MKWYWWALIAGGGVVAIWYLWPKAPISSDTRATAFGAAGRIASLFSGMGVAGVQAEGRLL